jgi:hypothetical protein
LNYYTINIRKKAWDGSFSREGFSHTLPKYYPRVSQVLPKGYPSITQGLAKLKGAVWAWVELGYTMPTLCERYGWGEIGSWMAEGRMNRAD